LSPPAAAPANPVAVWRIGPDTQGGHGIDDTVMGQVTRVVGRTKDVIGTMEIVDTTVTMARVIINMRTVACHCTHDVKYHDMLETEKYPTSTFELTKPIVLTERTTTSRTPTTRWARSATPPSICSSPSTAPDRRPRSKMAPWRGSATC
jgi:hypothetical protein